MRDYAAPASPGDQLPAADVLGHLMAIIATEYRTGIETQYGASDAIVVDVAVLTQQDAAGKIPVYRDALWFNIGLRLTLKKQMGQIVLARMGQGEAKGKNDPPFTLVDATQDAQAVAFAEAWLDQHPDFEKDAMRKAAEAAGRPVMNAPAAATPQVPPVPSVPSVPAPVNAAVAVPQVPAPVNVAPVNGAAGNAPTATAVQIDPAVIASLPADQQAAIYALMGQTK